MKINDLFFHIHYCNARPKNENGKHRRKITRTLGHHELILIIRGAGGSITIDQKRYSIHGGMLFYICPGVLHSIDIDADENTSFFSVHFSYAHVHFNDGKWEVQDVPETLPLHPSQEVKDLHIEDVFKKLVEVWYEKLPGYEFTARIWLGQLLLAIFQDIRKKNQNFASSLKVEKIIQYMHQNIGGKVNLTELSGIAHLSPAYLSRTFKETTGYSVIEYFNKIKIDKAKEMFIDGDKKVKDIAKALGFTDEFYFSRCFKKIEGISPVEYYSKNVHGV